ncbi:MAG: RES domain-containing protein [Cellvibrionaceae bacterium]|nr:RES domain-containing protein [Cellvibrionaceae bacterium]
MDTQEETIEVLSLAELAEQILFFNEKDLLRKCPREYLPSIVSRMVKDLPGISFDITDTSIEFFRGRKIENVPKYNCIHEILAPPPKKVTTYQRCNLIEQSILYTASNIPTALLEINANTTDRVQFVVQHLNENSSLKVGCVGLLDYVRRFGVAPHIFNTLDDRLESVINGIKQNVGKDIWQKALLFDAFIADWFSRPVDSSYESGYEYALTALYSNIMFRSGIDVIAYPSVGHKGGWNFALKPEIASEKITPVGVFIYEITENLGYGLVNASVKAEAKRLNNGAIEW